MMIPFPADVVGAWMADNEVQLSSKAYNELCTLITFYCDRAGGGTMPVPEFLKVNE